MNRATWMAAAALLFLAMAPVFPQARLAGTILSEPSAAPDFTLTDQHGAAYHMAETKGKVVVLTFIYTHCTDICPFISIKLKQAHALLGKDADRVVFLAVSTDPSRDTLPVIAAYSREVGLFDIWHFLTGPAARVRVVWDKYQVGIRVEAAQSAEETPQPESDEDHAQGLNLADQRLADRIIQQFGGGYEVSHTVPFWIIDRKGNFRVLLDADASPQDIAGDARILMLE